MEKTRVRVVDAFPLGLDGEVLVGVDVLAGGPEGGMTFVSPDEPGRWFFATPVFYIPDRSVNHELPRLPITLRAVEGNTNAIKPGVILIEV